jgi:hypothetical protein
MIWDYENKMYCPRCNGILRYEISYHEGNVCEGLSCVKCGEWIDDIILANREESMERIKVLRPNKIPRILNGRKLSWGKVSLRHDEIVYYFRGEQVKKENGLNQSIKQ